MPCLIRQWSVLPARQGLSVLPTVNIDMGWLMPHIPVVGSPDELCALTVPFSAFRRF